MLAVGSSNKSGGEGIIWREKRRHEICARLFSLSLACATVWIRTNRIEDGTERTQGCSEAGDMWCGGGTSTKAAGTVIVAGFSKAISRRPALIFDCPAGANRGTSGLYLSEREIEKRNEKDTQK